MATIYLRHPMHGEKVATMEQEAQYDETLGWERFTVPDPYAVVEPTPEPEAVVEPTPEPEPTPAPRGRGRPRNVEPEPEAEAEPEAEPSAEE